MELHTYCQAPFNGGLFIIFICYISGMARPVTWTPERMEEAKVLYLQLLRAGKTEDEIDAVEGVPCWDYRAQWLSDASFSDDVQRARALGAERLLLDGEKILADTYNRALDDAASPQLVAVTDQIMKHRRWKVAKFAPKVYGDKLETKNEHSGPGGGPIQTVVVGSPAVKELLDKI